MKQDLKFWKRTTNYKNKISLKEILTIGFKIMKFFPLFLENLKFIFKKEVKQIIYPKTALAAKIKFELYKFIVEILL